MIDTVFIILLSVFCLQLLLSVGIIYLSQSNYDDASGEIASISVIIPFRNERERIVRLLKSLNNVTTTNKLKTQFIFVDDHSEDDTAELIKKNLTLPYTITTSQDPGKKAALHEGIQFAEADYILTLDADVELPKDYFVALADLPAVNMWVLPVQLSGSSFTARLGAVDFSWIQLLTRALINTRNPVLANGANLMFSKWHYHVAHETRDDMHIASGDDLFLLAAFRQNGFTVATSDDSRLTIKTQAANKWTELLQQRKRWAMKMNRLVNAEVVTFGGLLVLSQIAFVCALFWAAFNPLFLIPIGIKYLSELLMTSFGEKRFSITDVFVLLLHQIWFPLYMIAVFLWPVPPEYRWVRR